MPTLTQTTIDRWHAEFNDDEDDRAAHANKATTITDEKAAEIATEIARRQFEGSPGDESIDCGIVLDVLNDHQVHPAFEDAMDAMALPLFDALVRTTPSMK
jgi:hypothetical protein